MNTSKSNFNVKINSGKRREFEVNVYYTSVNDKWQYINGTQYALSAIAGKIEIAIKTIFDETK